VIRIDTKKKRMNKKVRKKNKKKSNIVKRIHGISWALK